MPQRCTICTHLQREEMESALVGGQTIRHVARAYGVGRWALGRHKINHLPVDLARAAAAETARAACAANAAHPAAGSMAGSAAPAGVERQAAADLARAGRLREQVALQQQQDETRALNVLAELELTFQRVRKVFDACDRWLADPDDPTRYDLGPRAHEIFVHYTQRGPQGGAPRHVKARLSELLARLEVEDGDLKIEGVQLRCADPRELVLKAAQRLEAQLELVARLVGQLQEQPTVEILLAAPWWEELRYAIVAALEPYPDARLAVVAGIQRAVGRA